jgi:hypothetical protein
MSEIKFMKAMMPSHLYCSHSYPFSLEWKPENLTRIFNRLGAGGVQFGLPPALPSAVSILFTSDYPT